MYIKYYFYVHIGFKLQNRKERTGKTYPEYLFSALIDHWTIWLSQFFENAC